MSAAGVIVVDVLSQDSPEVPFVEDDHVVETLAANATNHPFDALVHNSDRGRELAWPRLPSSDHLAIRHPERRHGVENLAPDPCLDSLCRQPSRSHR